MNRNKTSVLPDLCFPPTGTTNGFPNRPHQKIQIRCNFMRLSFFQPSRVIMTIIITLSLFATSRLSAQMELVFQGDYNKETKKYDRYAALELNKDKSIILMRSFFSKEIDQAKNYVSKVKLVETKNFEGEVQQSISLYDDRPARSAWFRKGSLKDATYSEGMYAANYNYFFSGGIFQVDSSLNTKGVKQKVKIWIGLTDDSILKFSLFSHTKEDRFCIFKDYLEKFQIVGVGLIDMNVAKLDEHKAIEVTGKNIGVVSYLNDKTTSYYIGEIDASAASVIDKVVYIDDMLVQLIPTEGGKDIKIRIKDLIEKGIPDTSVEKPSSEKSR